MEKVRFSRLELYDLVWKLPMNHIVRQYNIPRVRIKEACLKMEVPLPGSTYWTKSPYLKAPKPELSPIYFGNSHVEIVKKGYELQLRKTSKSTPLLDLVKEIRNDAKAPLKVSRSLKNPEQIIARTKLFWTDKEISTEVFARSEGVLFLNVSNAKLVRALCFMDALIKLLVYRGHHFELGESGSGLVIINNQAVTITLREAMKRIPPKIDEDASHYINSGEFVLRITNGLLQKEWRDKKVTLEDMLAVIVAKIELFADEEL
ncbi:hypothetical protein [Flavobacterium foetidum]|uniref:hypothetical protein n=1 Tax=Flavobacterium foetidum TaxID=2026681 RepID=UPI001075224A|nr:hypothetical protein [Flavobacterium foetidum]KAF2517165.1 hypothetical protein E0W73_03450 [Flavobacterium foetidum]